MPTVIVPTSVRGLVFRPESEAANEAAQALRGQGVRAIVVLLHGGGRQGTDMAEGQTGDINGCRDMSPAFVDLVRRMSDAIDVVVSGHSHQAYSCTIYGKLVTSAASGGRLITDIDLQIRRSDGDIVSKAARNLVVTREVTKDPAQTALLARYRPLGDTIGNRVVGSIAASLTRVPNEAGESPLGNVVADALLEAARHTPRAGAEIAIWNPGGIRADLVATPGPGPTPVTHAQVFSVMPFGNELIVKSISGKTLLQMLEEQFGVERVRIMQVSTGFTYAYDASRPPGRRIDRASVRINGAPLDPARQYRLATSNFLWGGGDGLTALAQVPSAGSVLVGVDYEILADYLSRHAPVRPGPQNRIRRIR